MVGYATPLVAHPGETVQIRVDTTIESYHAGMVRLTSAGPGTEVGAIPASELDVPRTLRGVKHPGRAGSSIAVGPADCLAELDGFTASLWVFPTLYTDIAQVLLGTLDEAEAAGWQLVLSEDRGFGVRVSQPQGPPSEHYTGVALPLGSWSHLTAVVDPESNLVQLFQRGLAGDLRISEVPLHANRHVGHGLLVIAAPHGPGQDVSPRGNGCFNGKVSEPVVLSRPLTGPEVDRLAEGNLEGLHPAVVCALDLATAVESPTITDRSRYHHPAVARNMPTVGVTGPRWTGRTSTFFQRPVEYAAVHFHDDDLEDAGWSAAFELDLPAGIDSGVYAARLETSECVDYVPLFVTPSGATSRANIAVLLPTLTYLAYADEHEILSNPPSFKAFTGKEARDANLGWRDRYSVDQGLLSLYDVHRDGSTVCFASTRRPLVNIRPDYVWPLLEGPHGLAVDLRLMSWLTLARWKFDLLTDHDLHAEGHRALDPYRVLITGGHPEYWTADMLDGLEDYLEDGGRLLYLGGNGLYWVAGIDRERPHIMEVRRGLAGSRPSTSPPGETWLITTSEEGGLWRHRGRGSHAIVGVGTAAMGAGPGLPYRRLPKSYEPEFEFVFDGIAGEEVGSTGEILGGAAAYEFDRADPRLGTPEAAHVLATATGFASLYFPVIEDFLGSSPELANPRSPLVRADMVLMSKGRGGAVFSTGSAAWCGSLLDKEQRPTDSAVVTGNVLRRFIETPDGVDPLFPIDAHARGAGRS